MQLAIWSVLCPRLCRNLEMYIYYWQWVHLLLLLNCCFVFAQNPIWRCDVWCFCLCPNFKKSERRLMLGSKVRSRRYVPQLQNTFCLSICLFLCSLEHV